jgi:hypothetical protein
MLNTALAQYVKDNAVQVDIDGELCYVITPKVLENVERGTLGKV